MVSRQFWETLTTTYPALIASPHSEAYRRLTQYFLFTPFMEEATGRVIVPYQTVAKLVGLNPHTHGFRASEWLERFEADVLALNMSDYIYAEGQARTVAPEIAPAALVALLAERSGEDDGGKVWFATGLPVSRRGLRAARDDYEQYLMSLSLNVDTGHPARPLIEYLLRQPQDTLRRVLSRNWPHVLAAVNDLPTGTERERRTREWCERLVRNLHPFRCQYYTDSPKTPRIFAAGLSVNQLPRALRRLAFAGEVECDIRACQLAVVARLWDIEPLQGFLASGASIWSELLSWVGVTEVHKPIVKRTIYSIIFGMGRKNLMAQLAEGDAQNEGIGTDAAHLFFQHQLVAALLAARGRQQRAVWAAGGCEDAWGDWVSVSRDDARRKKDVPSVLAFCVQSYELRLMMSVLPVLESEPQVSLLSWLHDGCTIHFGNVTKQARQEERLRAAVRREADALGVTTWLQVERLPALAQVAQANPTQRLAV